MLKWLGLAGSDFGPAKERDTEAGVVPSPFYNLTACEALCRSNAPYPKLQHENAEEVWVVGYWTLVFAVEGVRANR